MLHTMNSSAQLGCTLAKYLKNSAAAWSMAIHSKVYGRSSRNVSAGCGGRRVPSAILAWTSGALRTAKSCGPDAPTLASSFVESSAKRRGQESPVPGESTKDTVKTIAQGMPDDLADPVVTAACFFVCRRAMGEAFTRHSLRPLSILRVKHAETRVRIRAARMRTHTLSAV
jgi:hypothetical protein